MDYGKCERKLRGGVRRGPHRGITVERPKSTRRKATTMKVLYVAPVSDPCADRPLAWKIRVIVADTLSHGWPWGLTLWPIQNAGGIDPPCFPRFPVDVLPDTRTVARFAHGGNNRRWVSPVSARQGRPAAENIRWIAALSPSFIAIDTVSGMYAGQAGLGIS